MILALAITATTVEAGTAFVVMLAVPFALKAVDDRLSARARIRRRLRGAS